MNVVRIDELLSPFFGEGRLTDPQLEQIAAYIDLLLRWNARMNLSSVRDAEEIVSRHFGESLFLARHATVFGRELRCIDVGSGAGFPGLPIKIYRPQVQLTLVESQYRKAIFLREVIRTLELNGAEVFAGRAEDMAADSGHSADLVTMRAVERCEEILPVAARLVRRRDHPGTLALLVGASAAARVSQSLLQFQWGEPFLVPQSRNRVLLLGSSKGESVRNQESKQVR